MFLLPAFLKFSKGYAYKSYFSVKLRLHKMIHTKEEFTEEDYKKVFSLVLLTLTSHHPTPNLDILYPLKFPFCMVELIFSLPLTTTKL